MSSIPASDPIAAVASDLPPKPVTPAEALPVAPSAALDPLTTTESSFLDKARETILPIVEKVQTTAKPYTDAAAVKAQQLVEKIEGTAPPSSATQTRDVNTPLTAGSTTSTTTTGTTLPSAGEVTEKAKGVFEQVSSAVQSTFTQITNTIETRTTTDTHPGLITQVQNAVAKGQEKLDHILDGGALPATGVAGGHPVQTTTNSVPHSVGKEDPTPVGVLPPTSTTVASNPAAIV